MPGLLLGDSVSILFGLDAGQFGALSRLGLGGQGVSPRHGGRPVVGLGRGPGQGALREAPYVDDRRGIDGSRHRGWVERLGALTRCRRCGKSETAHETDGHKHAHRLSTPSAQPVQSSVLPSGRAAVHTAVGQ